MKLFYGICGEGLGHAGRSIALIERLEQRGHTVETFTFGDAYRLLETSGYRPHRIEGLRFQETSRGGVDGPRTLARFPGYLRSRRASIDFVRQLALVEEPDLFITDFEPLTALAAASLKTPCVSIDNQHKFCQPLEVDFPLRLRCYSWAAGAFVRWWIKSPKISLVAVLNACPRSRHFQRVDVLVREKIARLTTTRQDYILLYGRNGLGRRLAAAATAIEERFVAYGCEGPPAPNIEYKPAGYEAFARDLAGCKAVLCSAGQQLIGEARYFQKPMLVTPIPGQHEQEINAHYVRRERLGDFCPINSLTGDRVRNFLRQRYGTHRPANGVDQTLDLLRIGNG